MEIAKGMEGRLPNLKQGMELGLQKVEAQGHDKQSRRRATPTRPLSRSWKRWASGRPSTYASIIAVIVDRGYVRKQGKQLIPTFKAFLAMQVLNER